MATKTISIREDVYDLLVSAKREGESFSEVIYRLFSKQQSDLSAYFGALKDSPLLDALEEDVRSIRAQARLRDEDG